MKKIFVFVVTCLLSFLLSFAILFAQERKTKALCDNAKNEWIGNIYRKAFSGDKLDIDSEWEFFLNDFEERNNLKNGSLLKYCENFTK